MTLEGEKRRFYQAFLDRDVNWYLLCGGKTVEKNSMVDVQLNVGYVSGSRFRDAFLKIMGAPTVSSFGSSLYKADLLDTPLGPMVAIGDDRVLVLLEFINCRGLEREIEVLRKKSKRAVVPGRAKSIDLIEEELKCYFEGTLTTFVTPIQVEGTSFQKQVWSELIKIPYGKTISYLELGKRIKNRGAVRAIGSANGANQLALIIPCHRVINASGEIGGYGGGGYRKKWLIDHERV